MKTLLGYTHSLRCAEPIRLGHMTNSLFTLQTTHARRVAPDRDLLDLLQTPVVEVNGFRTDDLLLAKQALSQLSYTPVPGIRRQGSGIRSSDY